LTGEQRNFPLDPADSSWKAQPIGSEKGIILCLDDALKAPEAAVAEASNAVFEVNSPFYPGVRSPVSATLLEELAPLLQRGLHEGFGRKGALKMQNAAFAVVTAAPETLSPPQRIPHFDGPDGSLFAAVLYLCDPSYDGTGFFRHRTTGFESIDAARMDRYFASLRDDLIEKGRPAPAYMSGETDIYELVAEAPVRFNRLLLYRGNMLHSGIVRNAAALRGDPVAGRLTITCFMTVDERPAA